MLIGLGDSIIDSLVAGTNTPAPAGSPAANALVGSPTPNPAPLAVSQLRRGYAPERILGTAAPLAPMTTATAEATVISEVAAPAAYPFGLTGTQWLLILGGAAVLLYFVLNRKGGSR